TIFNKTKAFETRALQSFERGALFAYDLPSGYDFAGMSQTMRKELPVSMPSVYVARGPSTAPSDLISEMNKGKYIINYSGHGSTGVWAASSFFGVNSVPSVSNGTSPSIYNMLTCLNGFFLRPDADSLGESLLKSANGGAVSAWASTSETTPDVQLIMGTRFYNRLASQTIPRMGDLVRDAKTSIPAGADVRLSWALLGDPMLRVIAPTP
ncbi:MAG: C25 family cysteine peptidase, partial [Pyrinomonadaceae bacterium]